MTSEIEVRAWDPARAQVVVETAIPSFAPTTLDESTFAITSLADSFGDATHIDADRALPMAADEASRLASSIAGVIGSAAVDATGRADGDPRLRAGVLLELHFVVPFEGEWLLTRTRHVFDHRGYYTAFEVSGRQDRSLLGLIGGSTTDDHLGSGPALPGVVVGIVTDTQDPNKAGRVKVQFPWLSEDYQSYWARVAMPGISADRGLLLMPEIGDEVILVAFEHGDVRQPYVVGSVYAGDTTPSEEYYGSSDGAIDLRWLRTRKGHFLELSDADGREYAALDVDGKYVLRLEKHNQTIVIRSDGTIEITGQQDIKIESQAGIHLKGRDVKIEAQGSLELKANGGAKLEGATTQLKGNPIQLN